MRFSRTNHTQINVGNDIRKYGYNDGAHKLPIACQQGFYATIGQEYSDIARHTLLQQVGRPVDEGQNVRLDLNTMDTPT